VRQRHGFLVKTFNISSFIGYHTPFDSPKIDIAPRRIPQAFFAARNHAPGRRKSRPATAARDVSDKHRKGQPTGRTIRPHDEADCSGFMPRQGGRSMGRPQMNWIYPNAAGVRH
jgi:hypothetical protein